MAVLVFANLLKGGSGLDKSVINTCNALSESGYSVDLVSVVGKGDGVFESTPRHFKLSNKVRLHSLKNMTVPGLKNEVYSTVYRLRQRFLKADFSQKDILTIKHLIGRLKGTDVVIFTHPLQSVLYKIAGGGRAKTILQIHGNYGEETHNLELLNESDSVIDYLQVVAGEMIPELTKLTSFSYENIKFIPNIHIPCLVDRINDTNSQFNVSIIGSIQDRKNQIEAIRAISLCSEDVVLNIWGGGSGYSDYLKSYVSHFELDDRVKFRGFASEQDIYQGTDLVIMTSRSEGFSYVLMEAASNGIPCITYDFLYGPREIIQDSINGFIVEESNFKALAEKIDLLASSNKLYTDFSEAIKHSFFSQFTKDIIVEKYVELLELRKDDIDISSYPTENIFYLELPEACNFINVSSLSNTVNIKTNLNVIEKDITLMKTYQSGKQVELPYYLDQESLVVSKDIILDKLKYILHVIYDGEWFYLFNTSQSGALEILPYYSNHISKKDISSNIRYKDLVLTSSGTEYTIPFGLSLSRILDENGDEIDFRLLKRVESSLQKKVAVFSAEYSQLTFCFHSGSNQRLDVDKRLTFEYIWNTLDKLETDSNILQMNISGVYFWELIKVSLFESLMEHAGLWSKHFTSNVSIDQNYYGEKSLSNIDSVDTIVFEFPRKSEIDNKTSYFHTLTAKNAIISYPQEYSYSPENYDKKSRFFPIKEFLETKQDTSCILSISERKNISNIEEKLLDELGFNINLESFIVPRVNKFKKEYNYFIDLFRRVKPQEVIIPSAYWSAGIISAAKDLEIATSDIQYALITSKHPNYAFRRRVKYTPDNIYVWSDESVREELPNKKITVINELDKKFAFEQGVKENIIVCSQPRIRKKLIEATKKLAENNPKRKFIFSLHPDEKHQIESIRNKLLSDNVDVSNENTNSLISANSTVIGVYSSCLVDALNVGKKVYVVKIAGSEVLLMDEKFLGFSIIDNDYKLD